LAACDEGLLSEVPLVKSNMGNSFAYQMVALLYSRKIVQTAAAGDLSCLAHEADRVSERYWPLMRFGLTPPQE
jgi:hypothetical protein